jgi:hypothetical protein
MLKDVVVVRPLDGYRLHLSFEDGASGVVDLATQIVFRGVFEPLRDPEYFQLVRVDPELGACPSILQLRGLKRNRTGT